MKAATLKPFDYRATTRLETREKQNKLRQCAYCGSYCTNPTSALVSPHGQIFCNSRCYDAWCEWA